MARMLGRQIWYGVFCSCCNGPRSLQVEKRREERVWRAALRPEGELPTPLDDPTECRHGCNGDCVVFGSEVCNFICHPGWLYDQDVRAYVSQLWAGDWNSAEDAAYDHL